MAALLYLLTIVLLGASASIGVRIERGKLVDQPSNIRPLRLVTNLAALAGVGFLVWGFFEFSWWLPIIGILAHMVVGAFLVVHALQRGSAPGLGVFYGISGFATALMTMLAL